MGGHVILLNPASSDYYDATLKQAKKALQAYPKGLQIGGGIGAENAEDFLEAGASHVIVTSYVFRNGQIQWDNLEKLKRTVGRDKIVVDLSCRKRGEEYFIVTDRWQTFTKVRLCKEILCQIAEYCDEFLIHGVDVEGKASGIDERLASLLGEYEGIPVTYAGGIASIEDLEVFRKLTQGKIDFTVGSALDIFGGKLPYNMVKCYA